MSELLTNLSDALAATVERTSSSDQFQRGASGRTPATARQRHCLVV
jgi:hypothetical protein